MSVIVQIFSADLFLIHHTTSLIPATKQEVSMILLIPVSVTVRNILQHVAKQTERSPPVSSRREPFAATKQPILLTCHLSHGQREQIQEGA
jgi:hypothetical protein